MNERIKELSEQAEQYADEYFRGEPTWSEAFESKFAELIIRECIEIVRLVPYYSDRDFGDEAVYQEAIYKHFGVEE